MSHPNWKATNKLISERFIWPHLDKTVKDWCKECSHCQKSKVTRHTKTLPVTTEAYPTRFQHLQLDIVGPLPALSNYLNRYTLSFIDWSTNWIEATPISSITAAVIVWTFISTWFSRFRVPFYNTTDCPIASPLIWTQAVPIILFSQGILQNAREYHRFNW